MNELIHFGEWVLVWTCTQVARLVNVEIFVGVDETEHTDIEFTAIEKKWSFNVFLNDDFVTLLDKHVVDEVLPIAYDFNASASIFVLWFNYPNVLGQLTSWQPTFWVVIFLKSVKALSHLLKFWIVRQILRCRRDKTKSHRAFVSIIWLLKHLISFVVVAEPTNQTRFSTYTSNIFIVIVGERSLRPHLDSLRYHIEAVSPIKIDRFPNEINAHNCICNWLHFQPNLLTSSISPKS